MRTLKRELWPHIVTLNTVESDPKMYLIEAWLDQNMGRIKQRWNVVYRYSITDFYFKDDQDATVFSLRWL